MAANLGCSSARMTLLAKTVSKSLRAPSNPTPRILTDMTSNPRFSSSAAQDCAARKLRLFNASRARILGRLSSTTSPDPWVGPVQHFPSTSSMTPATQPELAKLRDVGPFVSSSEASRRERRPVTLRREVWPSTHAVQLYAPNRWLLSIMGSTYQ